MKTSAIEYLLKYDLADMVRGLGAMRPTKDNWTKDKKRYRLDGKTYPPNGLRERTRRRRQIAAGSLRVENGLSHSCPPVEGQER